MWTRILHGKVRGRHFTSWAISSGLGCVVSVLLDVCLQWCGWVIRKIYVELFGEWPGYFLVIFFITHNSQGFGTMKLLWEPLSNSLWQLTLPTLSKDLSALLATASHWRYNKPLYSVAFHPYQIVNWFNNLAFLLWWLVVGKEPEASYVPG